MINVDKAARALWRCVLLQAFADLAGPRPELAARREASAYRRPALRAAHARRDARLFFFHSACRRDLEMVCDLAGVARRHIVDMAQRLADGEPGALSQIWAIGQLQHAAAL